jgi:hypothetical protein
MRYQHVKACSLELKRQMPLELESGLAGTQAWE